MVAREVTARPQSAPARRSYQSRLETSLSLTVIVISERQSAYELHCCISARPAGRVTPDAIWQELNIRHRQIENAASGHDKRAEKAKLMLAYGSEHAQYLVQHGLMEDSSKTRPSAWGALLTTTATPSAADGAAATTIGVRKAGTGAGRTSVTGSSDVAASSHTAVPETDETILKRRAFILQAADSKQWIIDISNANSNGTTSATAAATVGNRAAVRVSEKRSSSNAPHLQSTFGAGWGSSGNNTMQNASAGKQQKAVLKVNAIQDALYAAATAAPVIAQSDGASPHRVPNSAKQRKRSAQRSRK
eukprot:10986-Heterococcus_DN1.PRE.1